jgi:hypothetical protein
MRTNNPMFMTAVINTEYIKNLPMFYMYIPLSRTVTPFKRP